MKKQMNVRIDKADRRLTPYGRRVGLISDHAWAEFLAKQERQERLKGLLGTTKLTGEMLETLRQGLAPETSNHAGRGKAESMPAPSVSSSDHFDDSGAAPAKAGEAAAPPARADLSSALGQSFAQLLKRPEITIDALVPILRQLAPEFFARPELSRDQQPPARQHSALPSAIRNELKSVETEIKYEGYLQQQQRAIERLKKAEQRTIPAWFDYRSVSGLSREIEEKLTKIRPRTLGHASRIPGVTPAAVSLVNVYIEIQARRREQVAAV